MNTHPDGLQAIIYGTPAPQGSKRHIGNGRMIESSKAVKPWREAVKWAWQHHNQTPPLTGPVGAHISFTLKKPASAPKRIRTWPSKKPDLDKLIRSTFDGLTEAGAWIDDSQVIHLTTEKTYPYETPNSLAVPGAIITIWQVKES